MNGQIPAGAKPHSRAPVEKSFTRLEDFLDFLRARPQTLDLAHIHSLADEIRLRGSIETRRFGACPAVVLGSNYREEIQARDMPGRCFAVLDLLDEATGRRVDSELLCLEGLTPFARLIKVLYPKAICSEYAPSKEDQRRIAPIPHVDAQAMTFGNGRFDAVISGDVFEHVPDLPKVLSECWRVLKPGGALISTFPFAAGEAVAIRKAELKNGVIRHLVAEPEYHGDPVRPHQGALVFQIPGWDIIDQCAQAGFSRAEMVYLSDAGRGLIGNNMDGLFALRAIA